MHSKGKITQTSCRFKPKVTKTGLEISSSSSSSSSSTTTTSKTYSATKPNTTTFAAISKNKKKKNSELPPTKTARFRKPEKIILGQGELDTLYIGNLSEDINESDLPYLGKKNRA